MTPETYCGRCGACFPDAEWARCLPLVPVAWRGAVVGYVRVVRHRACGTATAVPVKPGAPEV